MNKNMIKILALITAITTIATVGLTKKFNKDEIYEYLKEPQKESTQEDKNIITTDEEIKIENINPAPVEKEDSTVEEKDECIVVQATSDVNIRSGASSDSYKIGNLKLGDSAIRILTVDGWDLANYNGTLGYINSDYLEYTDTVVETEYSHIPEDDIVITTTGLNFRSLPSTDGQKLDTLEPNTELRQIAEVDNGWLLVSHNGRLGYVSAEYTTSLLDKLNDTYPELNLNELEIESVIYNNATRLNLRQEPNYDSEILGEFERYETMRVIQSTDEWSLVMTNDYKFGYVFKEYTRELDGVFITVDKSEQRLTMYNDSEVLIQTPVTTGKDSTPSDTGNFSIYSKERDRYLTGTGYRSFVEYWMPYNGGEGIHDASWRSVFGTESYHTSGSHGCINTPIDAVKKIWEKAEVGTKVLVHK